MLLWHGAGIAGILSLMLHHRIQQLYNANFVNAGIFKPLALCVVLLFLFTVNLHAQEEPSSENLKELSLEELMNLQVTSVSKIPEKLNETASAIQVVTSQDIHRFGATSIPEALYLAGNLQVAQKASHAWGISARGFNTELANKMLVLMDGRTIYTPLYSGVFWDRQDYLLEDIDRIEVISGPGGTLWGANAVNGVINITSKSADKTQGLFAEAGGGNELQAIAGARYGGKIGSHITYRVYGKYDKHDDAVRWDSTLLPAHDNWQFGQAGFRVDARPSDNSNLTFQGDWYDSPTGQLTGTTSRTIGWNLLGRWTQTFKDSSQTILQVYYDHTHLTDPTPAAFLGPFELAPAGVFIDQLGTFDMDFQHHLGIGQLNRIVWGLGFRRTQDQNQNSPGLAFLPDHLTQNLYNIFAQDEIQLLTKLMFTIGTKLEHNDYTGYEVEPSARLQFQINESHMIWGAVSRSVRVPSRIDRDFTEPLPPALLILLRGDPNFRSERVLAHELGYRAQFSDALTGSLSLYYNHYTDLRSTTTSLPPGDPNLLDAFPLYFRNDLAGETYGAELNIAYEASPWWQLALSANRLKEHLWVVQGGYDFNQTHNETADPAWQVALRSTFSLPYGITLNPDFRWVDKLMINNASTVDVVPAYAELNFTANYPINNHFEVSVTGRNLLHAKHIEYGFPGTSQEQIERGVYGRLSVHF